jgi:hypothetical protein
MACGEPILLSSLLAAANAPLTPAWLNRENRVLLPPAGLPSTKMTYRPVAMLRTLFSAKADMNELELSSTFQPEISIATAPALVRSNQSAATGDLPLRHGATTVVRTAAWTSANASVTVAARVKRLKKVIVEMALREHRPDGRLHGLRTPTGAPHPYCGQGV